MNFAHADALNEAIRAIGIRHRALSVAALAPFGIHPGHKLILFELETAGPSTQAQLAAASGYEPPTITLSVRQLEEAGLVVRGPSSSDRRATVVELSDQGRALLPKLKAAWRRVAEQTVAGLHGNHHRPAHWRSRRPGLEPDGRRCSGGRYPALHPLIALRPELAGTNPPIRLPPRPAVVWTHADAR